MLEAPMFRWCVRKIDRVYEGLYVRWRGQTILSAEYLRVSSPQHRPDHDAYLVLYLSKHLEVYKDFGHYHGVNIGDMPYPVSFAAVRACRRKHKRLELLQYATRVSLGNWPWDEKSDFVQRMLTTSPEQSLRQFWTMHAHYRKEWRWGVHIIEQLALGLKAGTVDEEFCTLYYGSDLVEPVIDMAIEKGYLDPDATGPQ